MAMSDPNELRDILHSLWFEAKHYHSTGRGQQFLLAAIAKAEEALLDAGMWPDLEAERKDAYQAGRWSNLTDAQKDREIRSAAGYVS
jgi:hypothetical protein